MKFIGKGNSNNSGVGCKMKNHISYRIYTTSTFGFRVMSSEGSSGWPGGYFRGNFFHAELWINGFRLREVNVEVYDTRLLVSIYCCDPLYAWKRLRMFGEMMEELGYREEHSGIVFFYSFVFFDTENTTI
jgi:hypothetical protein